MTEPCPKMRLAIMTFVYEADRHIAFDLLDSVLRSCQDAEIDVFLTDDASPSNVGEKIISWCRNAGVNAICLRDEENLGFRGAIYRTVRLLKAIASQPKSYDVILRIDTDALVIRPNLGAALQQICTDRTGLYGVIQYMRPKDRLGFLLDLLPIGLKRDAQNGSHITRTYSLSRFSPVWWWRIGVQGLLRGFRFGFVQGSCYVLGGDVPRKLQQQGLLNQYNAHQFGLITSEEDVIVTLMCTAAELPIYEVDQTDPTWRQVNSIRETVLTQPLDQIPYVIHPLKSIPADEELRTRIKQYLPFFKETEPVRHTVLIQQEDFVRSEEVEFLPRLSCTQNAE
jgi:hypothetical protein